MNLSSSLFILKMYAGQMTERVFPVSFFSRYICSMIALPFSGIFAGIEAVPHPSSRACPSSNRGLGKNEG